MNRRNFLKRCSLIPFVGSLSIIGRSVASGGKPQLTLAKLMEAKKALDATVDDEDFLIPVDLDYYGQWPACLVKPDGIEFIHYKDFYKTKLI